MAWEMPIAPDKLKALLMAKGGAPGVPGQPPVAGPPMAPAPLGPPAAPAPSDNPAVAAPAQPVAPKPAPSPTDDPAVSKLPPLPQAPNLSNGPLQSESARYGPLADQLANLKPPLRSDPQNQPGFWRKALTIPAAIASGPWAPLTIDAMLHGKYKHAMEDYSNQRTSLKDQVDAEREVGVPLAKDTAAIPQTNFTNQMDVAKEARERASMQSKENYYQGKMDMYGDKFVSGSEKQDPSSPTGWTADTFKGETKPWTPKDASKTIKPVKTAAEALSEAYAATDPQQRKTYMDLHDKLYEEEKNKINMEHPDRDGEKPATKGQFNGANTRKEQALAKAERDYRKALTTATSDQDKQDALGDLNDAKQAAQDAFENEVTTLGGTAQHVDITAAPGGKKPANPQPDGKSSAPTSQTMSVTKETKTMPKSEVGKQVISSDVVSKYAAQKKMTPEQAKKALEATGKYTVQ